jgi:hypothetical protein
MSQAAVQRPPARFDASVVTGAKPAPFPGLSSRVTRLYARRPLLARSGGRSPPSVSLFAERLEGEGAQMQERTGAMGVIVETAAPPPNL